MRKWNYHAHFLRFFRNLSAMYVIVARWKSNETQVFEVCGPENESIEVGTCSYSQWRLKTAREIETTWVHVLLHLKLCRVRERYFRNNKTTVAVSISIRTPEAG